MLQAGVGRAAGGGGAHGGAHHALRAGGVGGRVARAHARARPVGAHARARARQGTPFTMSAIQAQSREIVQ